MSCSLRRWVMELPWMQQGVLFGAFRNCDGVESEGPHKTLTRGIRATCIKSARTTGSFLARRPDNVLVCQAVTKFMDKCYDEFPMHFVLHLMHAAEVIAYAHPDPNIRRTWWYVYYNICNAMHLNPEMEVQFKSRLQDDPEQVAREEAHDADCWASKCYGDNYGTVNEESV